MDVNGYLIPMVLKSHMIWCELCLDTLTPNERGKMLQWIRGKEPTNRFGIDPGWAPPWAHILGPLKKNALQTVIHCVEISERYILQYILHCVVQHDCNGLRVVAATSFGWDLGSPSTSFSNHGRVRLRKLPRSSFDCLFACPSHLLQISWMILNESALLGCLFGALNVDLLS